MSHSADNLDRLIQDKTYVVVQRLFHTKSVEHIAEINKEIQQVIKSQNLTLRKLFFSKYMELLNCSKLINDVETFTKQIDQISTDILKNAEKYREADIVTPIKEDTISILMRLIRKGKLLEAMKIATNDRSAEQIVQICQFDILEAVEQKLQTTLKTEEIEQIIKCLALFIYKEAERYKDIDCQQEYGRPLSILMRQYDGSKDPSQCLIASIKTAFFILTTAIRQVNKKEDIIQYMRTLEHIMELTQTNFQKMLNSFTRECQLPQSHHRPTNNSLHDVEICCFAELHKSLAKTMLSHNNKIRFNHELYESIIKDQELLENLRKLERTLNAKNSLENVLKTLWKDFYRQIVDSAVLALDISQYCQSMLKSTMLPCDHSLEIQKHMQDKTAQKILQIFRKYSHVLHHEIEQLSAVMQQDIKKYLQSSLASAIDKWPHKILQYFGSLTPKQKIMLTIGCQLLREITVGRLQQIISLTEFEKQMQRLTGSQVQLASQEMTKQHPKIEQKVSYFEQRVMDFVPYLKNNEETIFKKIVFSIIKSLERCHSGRDCEKLKYTQRCLKNQAEELSTFSCLLQHIPRHLFGQELKIERSNVQATENMLLQEKSQRRAIMNRKSPVVVQDKKELFEIDARDVLKFASKLTNSFMGIIKGSSE